MKPELKSAAILAGTLALGVVLGMMAQAGLARGRSAELARLRQPPGFVAHFERRRADCRTEPSDQFSGIAVERGDRCFSYSLRRFLITAELVAFES